LDVFFCEIYLYPEKAPINSMLPATIHAANDDAIAAIASRIRRVQVEAAAVHESSLRSA
jgi:hypothetical protein